MDTATDVNRSIPVSAPGPRPSENKSNKGCWILAAVGCGIVVLGLGAMIAFFVLLVASSGSRGSSISEDTIFKGGEGKIAVIDISGEIAQADASGGLLSSSYATTDIINEQLENARLDSSVKGVLIKMDSPGGEVIASDLIYRKVKEVSAEKPVVTWMSSMGASGGYMIAVASDKIIAHPGTVTGSIGVIMQASDMTGLYEKLGIKIRTFKSGEFKDGTAIFDEDPNGEGDQIYQSLIDEAYESFITIIAENRDMPLEEVRGLADGRIYTGKQAAANGLVDEVGYMEDAITALEELSGSSNLSVVEYSVGSFWGSLYQYEQLLLNKMGGVAVPDRVGVRLYYIMEI